MVQRGSSKNLVNMVVKEVSNILKKSGQPTSTNSLKTSPRSEKEKGDASRKVRKVFSRAISRMAVDATSKSKLNISKLDFGSKLDVLKRESQGSPPLVDKQRFATKKISSVHGWFKTQFDE